ncbi:uncharacterized protein JCM6883_004590 [Sporobolomyces salmoneus]|uniref:uncharacterized protein n=1 Tax=Sporobolomyces salmoneus TaxID=183962 RepID=UPI0031784393
MDAPHSETEYLAAELFDRHGRFKRKFSSEGTGVWGQEVNRPKICYLESIKIFEGANRGKGIGTWALNELWKTYEHLEDKEALEDIDFLFTLPAPMPEELPSRDTPGLSKEKVDQLREQEWDRIVDSKINPFLRRVSQSDSVELEILVSSVALETRIILRNEFLPPQEPYQSGSILMETLQEQLRKDGSLD